MLLYPGDKSIEIRQVKNVDSNDWNLTNITLSSHLGTHVDSPKHVLKDGIGIDQLGIEKFTGNSQVLDLRSIPFGEKITQKHLKPYLIQKNDIILFKTRNSSILNEGYNPNHVELSLLGAQYLVDLKIKAVAIDYLSIGTKDVHEMLLKSNILIYETVNLSDIEAGNYFFMGLPLKIPTEGSPVRAVLIQNA